MQRASATPEVIETILAIGHERKPNEACGVVLPPYNQVLELPNMAKDSNKAYEIDNEDLVELLASQWLDGDLPDSIGRSDIVIWHTHPSGFIGPSKGDMEGKAEGFRYLVVSMPNGEASLF